MKQGLILSILLLAAASLVSCTQTWWTPEVVQLETIERDFSFSLPLYSADSAWNQTATSAAAVSGSDNQILVTYRVLRGDISSLEGYTSAPTTWPFMDVNYDDYSIPIFRAEKELGVRRVTICDYDGNLAYPSPKWAVDTLGGPITVQAPGTWVRPAGPQDTDADGHLVLYNPGNQSEFDFWQATTTREAPCQSLGGGISGEAILEAGYADFFNVLKAGANMDGYSSARASGVPLLAGLILPEDVESGSIAHALVFAIPGPRNTSATPFDPLIADYFYPASMTETDYYNQNPNALAAGQRIRLKPTIVDENGDMIDESGLAPITQMFLAALRNYGAYLVDNAGGFSFYAEDIHTAQLDLSDSQVKTLIGETSLPAGKTKWQIVMEKLNQDLELIPIAYGPWTQGQDPTTATITTSNFEVIEPASLPQNPF